MREWMPRPSLAARLDSLDNGFGATAEALTAVAREFDVALVAQDHASIVAALRTACEQERNAAVGAPRSLTVGGRSIPLPLSIPALGGRCDPSNVLGLEVERPPHPVTKAKYFACFHDRMHGVAHKKCHHRNPNIVDELSKLNTSVSEQTNRSK